MENNKRSPKANRILYTSVVAALCVVALIIGIVAAANRTTTPTPSPGTTPTTGSTQPPVNERPNDQETDLPTDGELTFTAPVLGAVSKEFEDEERSYSETMADWRTHPALDIAAALGDTVRAAADGTVKEIWDDAMMGKCVAIEHEGEILTVYKNLGEVLADGIEVGTRVSSGDAIATVGESALRELGEEPHLHFEMSVKGEAVDPLEYLSEESRETLLGGEDNSYEG